MEEQLTDDDELGFDDCDDDVEPVQQADHSGGMVCRKDPVAPKGGTTDRGLRGPEAYHATTPSDHPMTPPNNNIATINKQKRGRGRRAQHSPTTRESPEEKRTRSVVIPGRLETNENENEANNNNNNYSGYTAHHFLNNYFQPGLWPGSTSTRGKA